jgi:hypothetical protein
VIATSTQGNSLNQDLNGVGANYNQNATWASLGALSDPTTPFAAVPEVNPTWLVLLLLAAVVGHRRFKMRPLGIAVRSCDRRAAACQVE